MDDPFVALVVGLLIGWGTLGVAWFVRDVVLPRVRRSREPSDAPLEVVVEGDQWRVDNILKDRHLLSVQAAARDIVTGTPTQFREVAILLPGPPSPFEFYQPLPPGSKVELTWVTVDRGARSTTLHKGKVVTNADETHYRVQPTR
ncbi:hypothetical protein GCM10009846_10190 [Agrococcus versicolor]|uniref:Uncharacterized protein n=1 Tax=Agrococcus versicolor TaxID=501482 RepID=A0ABN3AMR5_9MICO